MADFFLHELASIGDFKQLEVLFRVDGVKNINARDEDIEGQTALHWSVLKGHVACCRILLDNGANASSCMTQGWTPAHCAAEVGSVEILTMLREYNGDVLAQDSYGDTPKRIAQVYGHEACVSYLDSVEKDVADDAAAVTIDDKKR